jgi:hypothetical protein
MKIQFGVHLLHGIKNAVEIYHGIITVQIKWLNYLKIYWKYLKQP